MQRIVSTQPVSKAARHARIVALIRERVVRSQSELSELLAAEGLATTQATLSRDLRASTAIRLLPGSRWVTVHLDCDSDVDLLISLVSMALQAHQSAIPEEEGPRCNLHRVMLVPRDEPLV